MFRHGSSPSISCGWAFYGSSTVLPIALSTPALQARRQQRVVALETLGRKHLVSALAVRTTALATVLATVVAAVLVAPAVLVALVALVALGAALLWCRGWMLDWGGVG